MPREIRSMYPRKNPRELARIRRFDEVMIEPGGFRQHLVVRPAAAGERNEGSFCGFRAGAPVLGQRRRPCRAVRYRE